MKKLLFAVSAVLVLSGSSFAADKILAKVNGKAITESQLQSFLDSLPPNYNKLKQNPNFRKQVLNSLINEELLYQEAKKEKLEDSPEVKKQMEEAKKKILINALLKKHVKVSNISISDKEVKEFYEKNKSQFVDANGKPVPYESLKSVLKQTLQQQKEQEAVRSAVNAYINELRKKNKVELVSDLRR